MLRRLLAQLRLRFALLFGLRARRFPMATLNRPRINVRVVKRDGFHFVEPTR